MASNDGAWVARVRNHFEIDPPNQSLWLGRTGEKSFELQRLGPDQDWCDAIAWSSDSSLVAFLVQDAWVLVYEAESRRLVQRADLVERDGLPTRREVRELGFRPGTRVLVFETCDRRTGSDCLPGTLEVPL